MAVDPQILIDSAAEINVPPGDYFALWNDLADWQLEALKQLGLEPKHRLLDIGCGAMRLGLIAAEYLEGGNYYGVDAYAPYIDLGPRLAARVGLRKKVNLLLSDSFEFSRFGAQFDLANAQSVFTHLSAAQCDACMAALRPVMKAGARFLFTYLVGVPKTQGFLYGGLQPMQRLAIADAAFFAELGSRHGAKFERLDMTHPTGQQVGLYRYG
jgi:cyclopropane fatty-acyl-phospholipid synthase-like methyltransferase